MLRRFEDLLFFLIILFLPTQLGRHFWPEFSYIYSLKIDYLSPTLYFWDLLVVGLLAVWILQKARINKTALNLLLLFLFTQILSLIGAVNVGAGLVRLEQYSLVGFFGVYLASVGGKVIRKKIFLPLGLAVLGESVLAMVQFLKGGTLGLWILGERSFTLSTPGIAKFDIYGYEFLRPYATFPHPNVLAAFMLLSIVILRRLAEGSPANAGLKLVERFFAPLRMIKKWLRMIILDSATFLASLTVFLTMSRTAILAGFIALVVLLKRKWIISIIIITLILSPVLFVRFSAIFNFDSLTLLRREELSVSALRMFLEFPIFGVGLNNFIPAVAGELLAGPSRFLQPVHNIFLLALSETGILGLLGLLGLIGLPIFRLFKLYPKPYTLNPILPWLIILFLGMFDHYFLTLPQGYRLLFLVWGLSFSMLK